MTAAISFGSFVAELERLLRRESLLRDQTLAHMVSADNSISAELLLSHPILQRLRATEELLLEAAAKSRVLSVDVTAKTIFPDMTARRTTLIIRELPAETELWEICQLLATCPDITTHEEEADTQIRDTQIRDTQIRHSGASNGNGAPPTQKASNEVPIGGAADTTGGVVSDNAAEDSTSCHQKAEAEACDERGGADATSNVEEGAGGERADVPGGGDQRNIPNIDSQRDRDIELNRNIVEIRKDVGDCWFITLSGEALTQKLAVWLRSKTFKDQTLKVGIKSSIMLRQGSLIPRVRCYGDSRHKDHKDANQNFDWNCKFIQPVCSTNSTAPTASSTNDGIASDISSQEFGNEHQRRCTAGTQPPVYCNLCGSSSTENNLPANNMSTPCGNEGCCDSATGYYQRLNGNASAAYGQCCNSCCPAERYDAGRYDAPCCCPKDEHNGCRHCNKVCGYIDGAYDTSYGLVTSTGGHEQIYHSYNMFDTQVVPSGNQSGDDNCEVIMPSYVSEGAESFCYGQRWDDFYEHPYEDEDRSVDYDCYRRWGHSKTDVDIGARYGGGGYYKRGYRQKYTSYYQGNREYRGRFANIGRYSGPSRGSRRNGGDYYNGGGRHYYHGNKRDYQQRRHYNGGYRDDGYSNMGGDGRDYDHHYANHGGQGRGTTQQRSADFQSIREFPSLNEALSSSPSRGKENVYTEQEQHQRSRRVMRQNGRFADAGMEEDSWRSRKAAHGRHREWTLRDVWPEQKAKKGASLKAGSSKSSFDGKRQRRSPGDNERSVKGVNQEERDGKNSQMTSTLHDDNVVTCSASEATTGDGSEEVCEMTEDERKQGCCHSKCVDVEADARDYDSRYEGSNMNSSGFFPLPTALVTSTA